MKTTKAQNQKIRTLTNKFGMNENLSELEKDGTYYFESAYNSGYAVIQRNGKIESGNLN